jgi:hypothetical protein
VPGIVRETLSDESGGNKEVPVTAMSVRFLLTAGLTLSLLCGCRRDPRMQVYIENVNAEKRLLEDTLYDLQYDYETKLKEVERLQAEVARLKGTSTGGSATGGAAKVKAPSAPGGDLFPDIPELKPPTVESGTPDTEKTTPGNVKTTPNQGKSPPQPSPRELEDMDDLEPPKLELPEEKGTESVAPAEPAAPAPAEPKVTPPSTPPAKLASRWTPRSVRRPDPPQRRFHVADQPGTSPTTAESSAAGPAADNAPGGPLPTDSSADAAAKQARRPSWRPYR